MKKTAAKKQPAKKPVKTQGRDTLSVLGIPFGKVPKSLLKSK